MSEDKKPEVDAKAKMLEALAKKQKETPLVRVLDHLLVQSLVLGKQEGQLQRCTVANLALLKKS